MITSVYKKMCLALAMAFAMPATGPVIPMMEQGRAEAAFDGDMVENVPSSVVINVTSYGKTRPAMNEVQSKLMARRAAMMSLVSDACKQVEGANKGAVKHIYDEQFDGNTYTITADVQVWNTARDGQN